MSTIKEIARRAGVSPTTVSNVLNGHTARVSPQTREKVEALLQEEHYTPNMAAHILAHNRSRIVGVIMFMEPRRNETVIEDPFSSTILGAIEVELRRHGYFMMLHTTSDEAEVMRLARAWKPAGLIILWAPNNTISVMRRTIRTPVVFVDSYYDGDPHSYFSVGLEDQRGGYEMARYLISMGHRELVFLANDYIIPGTDYARFIGCREALAEIGHQLDDTRFISLSKDRRERIALYEQLGGASRRFSAMVFSSDYYAAEAISFFQEKDWRIPEDFSITGFDDNIFARLMRPRLTTIHQDVNGKGVAAVDLLVAVIHKKAIFSRHIKLPVHLEIRDSVMRLAQSGEKQ
jgi:LacI family transcriptional regulator